MQIPSFVCSGTMVIELHYKKMDKMQVVNMFYAVKSDLKLKARSNVWGEYKNHSNPYNIQGMVCDQLQYATTSQL